MLGRSGGYLPVRAVDDLPRADIPRDDDGRGTRQHPAPRGEGVLAQGVVDPGDPVVCERALVLVHDPVGDALGQVGPVHLQIPFAALEEVPAAEDEARVIDVVIVVVVREEEVFDLASAGCFIFASLCVDAGPQSNISLSPPTLTT